MRTTARTLLTGVAIAVGVPVAARLTGDEGPWWVLVIIGAVLALALWVMLWAGAAGRTSLSRAVVDPRAYAGAGVLGILLGPVLMGMVSDNRAFWAVGFILAGTLLEASSLARRDVEKS